MSSPNDIRLDIYAPHPDNNEQNVLVDLPEPKQLISDDCTIILNGHHNYVSDRDNNVQEEPEEESKPFLDALASSEGLNGDLDRSKKLDISSNMFRMKESSVAASLESGDDSDGEGEHESCTHLLQSKDQEVPSPKCQKTKVHKIPTFRSSPSKKHSSHDAHSHIQHRPLGLQDNSHTVHSSFFLAKWNRSVPKLACMALAMSILLALSCLALGFYLTGPMSCCETNKQWWQDTVIYEIFPASFQDTDSDGFGDIAGIIERLDYIQNMSIDIIRLSSIFSALDYPLEYEHVIDFSNIDPHLGRMEDFEALVKDLHDRGMFVILDMNPTVTSDQHTWAAHWLLHRPGRYEHFYVNVTDDEVEPPLESNPQYTERDWTPPHRTFGSHLFLNWSNPLVQLEMEDVLEFWLSQGVDGFYMKHVENMRVQEHEHVALIYRQWRYLLYKYSTNSTKKILMTSESTMEYLDAILDTVSYLSIPPLLDLVDVSLDLASGNGSLGEDFKKSRQYWRQFPFPSPMQCWHLGSVETMRLASKLGDKSPMAGFLLLAALPGSWSVYYGDELAVKDSIDPFSTKPFRGGQLGPMHWSAGHQANFTSSTPWIPVNSEYQAMNALTRSDLPAMLRRIVDLKKGSLLKPPGGASLVHDIMNKLNGAYDWKEGPRYEWLSTNNGLLVVEVIRGHSFVYASNTGAYPQGFPDSKKLVNLSSRRGTASVDVVLSTNSSINGRVELVDFVLYPGDAFIGQFIT